MALFECCSRVVARTSVENRNLSEPTTDLVRRTRRETKLNVRVCPCRRTRAQCRPSFGTPTARVLKYDGCTFMYVFVANKVYGSFSGHLSPPANEMAAAGRGTARARSKSVRTARENDRVMRTLCYRARTALLNTTAEHRNPRRQ